MLIAIALATAVSGCGLKGDLYLEDPAAEQPQEPAIEAGTGQPTEAGVTAETPDATEELVNTEAAQDADPGSSIIEPGDIDDLEGPGDTAPAQLDDEAGMETGPHSAVEEPVSQVELKDSETDSAEDSGARTDMPTEADNADLLPATKEVAPAQ